MTTTAANKAIFLILVLLIAGQLFLPSMMFSKISVDFQRFHQLVKQRFGADRVQVSKAWEEMLQIIAGLSEQEKVLQVNQFFHQILEHETDLLIWGKEDYWATPLETLGQGRGDCEDWAIAKYFSLRIAGVEDQKLRLIYTTAEIKSGRGTRTEPHMVLGYYAHSRAEPLILDSLVSKVVPASQRPDLTPVFSFNSQGLWTGTRQADPAPGSSAPISRWRSVLERVKQQGASW